MCSSLLPARTASSISCAFAMVMPSLAGDPDASDPIAGKDHWAYQALPQPNPPTGSVWSPLPIDEYVYSRLQAEGLQPAADAQPRDLIRRLCVQLTGLPPTPDEVAEFLADESSGAVGRVVERLLASPRFGERWGRHWLDLARYADSNGLDENFLFREAWRYRNWVIDAVNADMPFDRFALEQIAGDLLPHDSIAQRDRQRIGAGFMVIGPKVLLGNDAKRQRMEVADEQIDTIGRTFLGLTLGCARCHDHKFDAVPTADYYALAGILTSTKVMEKRHMLGQQRVMERLVGLGADGDKLDASYETYWRELPKKKEAAKRANSALEFLKKEDMDGLNKLIEKHPDAVAIDAKESELATEKRIEAQTALVAERAAVVANAPKIPPRAMIPEDVESPCDEAIRKAGEFDQPGEKVARGVLRVLCRNDAIAGAGASPYKKIQDGNSGRIELGRWLTDVENGAGNLTARVLANRIWHHLIGRGIVRTVDNFGTTGEAPSHPKLLDYLASELIASGWSVKHLIREIVLSRTFGMSSSAVDERARAVDTDNRLLWRAHRRRLDPEALRDTILSAAGTLDLKPMESTVAYLGDQATAVGKNENRRRTDFPCRSVFLPVIRNDLPELFEVFDFADPHMTTGARAETTVAPQGLYMMNSPMVTDAADALAKRLLADDATADDMRIDFMFALMFSAKPTQKEKSELLTFIRDAERRLSDASHAEPKFGAWSMACHAMFSTSRFQFLD